MASRKDWPALRCVVLVDPRRTRWHDHVTHVCAGPHLERSVAPGEIAVFEPTGEEREVQVLHETREGDVYRPEMALVYRRERTRLVG